MSRVLQFENVFKGYGGAPAVRDLSFELAEGQICGFLGPNGAGKTTSLRMTGGMIGPDRGRVSLFGAAPNATSLKRVGFLPEERGLYKKMRADEIIAYFGTLKGLKGSVAMKRARELLERFGLGAHRTKPIKAMSKGMAQKVQILATIVHAPDFVILDEPFSGLDPVNQKILEELVVDLRKQGKTVLFSTHVMEHAERLCDNILLLAKGRKIFDGSVAQALALAPRTAILETDGGFALENFARDKGFTLARPMQIQADSGHHRVEVELPSDDRARELLAALVEARAPLRRFEPKSVHLHDVFVQLVDGPGEVKAA